VEFVAGASPGVPEYGGLSPLRGAVDWGGAMSEVLLDVVIEPRAPWSIVVEEGCVLRLTDLEGNQAIDFLMYDAHDPTERYSAPDTIAAQGNIFLREGSVLLSTEHRPMMTLTGSSVQRHDTVGGACSKESNGIRYGFEASAQHACVENFLLELSRYGLGKRDIQSNVNWFMNVPIEPDGGLAIVDGISGAGMWVELTAHRDVLVVISNCPQINNPCNGFSPSPVAVTLTRVAA
jgi:urea carboxylase-associated protein 1